MGADPVLVDSGALLEFRSQVRRWFAEHVPPGWHEEQRHARRDEYVAFQRWWLAELRAGGYAAPHWPTEWGGGGLSLPQQVVLYEEMARARAPRLGLYFVSLNHTPATLLHAGTDDQRRRHLPAILDGEVWCQGFSEPNAGSDLASLQTRAERDGDDYVVNGQKVWSSLADHADFCLLLARTDPAAPKRKGISYFLMDMGSPGVDVRPIRQNSGSAEFCEIFLTDVVIPASSRVGTENEGWAIAQATLTAERGPTIIELAERLRQSYDRLVELAARRQVDGHPALGDGDVRQRLARLYGEVEILRLLCHRMVENLLRRGGVGAEASIIKLYYSELLQRLTDVGVEIDGLHAHVADEPMLADPWHSGHWLLDFINTWMWTIAGGTNEIMRTIVGERVLGLPREPTP